MQQANLPPQNIDAEQSLLCSFIYGADPEDTLFLEAEDFYNKAHQNIWQAVHSLYKNKEPIDSVSILNELKSMGKLTVSGGGVYLAKLMDIPQATNTLHYAKIIKDCSRRRQAIIAANQLLQKAYDAEVDFDVLLKATGEKLSVLKNGHSRERKLTETIREWMSVTTGDISVTECDKELNIVTQRDKAARRQAFSRLCKDGIVERIGNKDGWFRFIDQTNDEMEFVEGDFYEYPVRLPFGLNDICEIYAQNIIIIAGCKGAGKTAFMLNLALKNREERDVIYLNSEMGAKEYTKRLNKFGIYKKKDIGFKCVPCHSNFHNKIKDDDSIYIVDYLEIHDNFYEVAKHIRLIHEKLKDNICIIAIQKKTNERLGRGAEFSMEKSRLYLSLDYIEEEFCSKLTIVDAKNLRTAMNFNGMSKRIKITNGSKIEALDKDWRRP